MNSVKAVLINIFIRAFQPRAGSRIYDNFSGLLLNLRFWVCRRQKNAGWHRPDTAKNMAVLFFDKNRSETGHYRVWECLVPYKKRDEANKECHVPC
jgi:hypothetical protein